MPKSWIGWEAWGKRFCSLPLGEGGGDEKVPILFLFFFLLHLVKQKRWVEEWESVEIDSWVGDEKAENDLFPY